MYVYGNSIVLRMAILRLLRLVLSHVLHRNKPRRKSKYVCLYVCVRYSPALEVHLSNYCVAFDNTSALAGVHEKAQVHTYVHTHTHKHTLTSRV